MNNDLIIGKGTSRFRRLVSFFSKGTMLLVTSSSAIAVFFIFVFIIRDAVPFFRLRGFLEFFTSSDWYPAAEPAKFGALPIFYGSLLVTAGAVFVSVPLGVAAAICISEMLPFAVRQMIKPVIEVLAAIPSVAYGFFALVVFAPALQNNGGRLLQAGTLFVGIPISAIIIFVAGEIITVKINPPAEKQRMTQIGISALIAVPLLWAVFAFAGHFSDMNIASGANALNVSIILGIMVLPTIVSVSEDALQSVGRELREGSYALGATRTETILKVVLPAASSGIAAGIILGIMRAMGETMVVWMASGNAAQIPKPLYDFLSPVRTLTATIAGDMGEADQISGAARYYVLFAMALCLLVFCFVGNLASEWAVRRTRRKLRGE